LNKDGEIEEEAEDDDIINESGNKDMREVSSASLMGDVEILKTLTPLKDLGTGTRRRAI
jgi:hypothetical protein